MPTPVADEPGASPSVVERLDTSDASVKVTLTLVPCEQLRPIFIGVAPEVAPVVLKSLAKTFGKVTSTEEVVTLQERTVTVPFTAIPESLSLIHI